MINLTIDRKIADSSQTGKKSQSESANTPRAADTKVLLRKGVAWATKMLRKGKEFYLENDDLIM